jgi:hypothetical protein
VTLIETRSMNLPLSSLETWLFFLLIFLWALFLFGGFVFGRESKEDNHRIPRWARMASSFCLVLGAWLWFAITQGTILDNLAAWLAIGMSLGFLGDLFMAELIPLQPHVLYGMGAFGLGHIAYIIGVARICFVQAYSFPNWPVLIFWWIFALVGWYIVVYRGSKPGVLHYAALPYAVLLATTAGAATSLALLDINFVLLAIGAALFLLSDLILAAKLFNELKFPLIGDVVWLTYGPGQMLIIFGLILFTIASSLLSA